MRVRTASPSDLDSIVRVHQQAFEGFLMTLLGPRFLRGYYQCVLTYAQPIFLVAEREGQVVGFVAGFVNPPRFYAQLRQRKLPLALAAASHLMWRPRLWQRALSSLRRAETLALSNDEPTLAELASVGVAPAAQGLGAGKQLVLAFLERARERGVAEVVLTTDAHHNDAVNAFYQKLGFTCMRQFWHTPERLMNEYRIRLEQVESPHQEPSR
ncbi:MAG: GNAT family N-acetyltransferase [Fimbriimonadales bacterium]|nr:GNAT family N-acetyltransferase [Fimbriimonadales bacterium]